MNMLYATIHIRYAQLMPWKWFTIVTPFQICNKFKDAFALVRYYYLVQSWLALCRPSLPTILNILVFIYFKSWLVYIPKYISLQFTDDVYMTEMAMSLAYNTISGVFWHILTSSWIPHCLQNSALLSAIYFNFTKWSYTKIKKSFLLNI